jgi:phospholipase C
VPTYRTRIYFHVDRPPQIQLRAGENIVKYWPLARFFGWYDFVLNIESDAAFLQQLAGHIETGRDSVTDPAIAE